MNIKNIETPWGFIRTPEFVYFIGFSMIFFSLLTIDFGKFAIGLTFLTFIFDYIREIGLIKFGLYTTLMRFGFDVSIFGGLWGIAGKLGFTNEDRHYAMLILCFLVSISIIQLANWEEGVIDASLHTLIEIINSILSIIKIMFRL